MTSKRSEVIARALSESGDCLDDLSRVRMERALLDRVRDEPVKEPRGMRRRVLAFGLGGAVLASAAALVVVLSNGGESAAPSRRVVVEEGTASAERTERTIAEGDTLETSPRQIARVYLDRSHVELEAGSHVRFDEVQGRSTALWLRKGSVRVSFHPRVRGHERMVVQTPLARVEVVGTVFRVSVASNGATTVGVDEGRVRVVSRTGGEVRYVSAREQITVELARATAIAPSPTVEQDSPVVVAVAVSAEPVEPTRRGEAERPATSDPVAPPEPPLDEARLEVVEAVVDAAADPTEEPSHVLHDVPRDERGVPLSFDVRFDLAETLLSTGQHASGRHILLGITRDARRRTDRARAWTLVGDSWRGERVYLRAAEAYRRAAQSGRGTLHALNAIYAIGMLREREIRDREGARAAYRQYLELASEGPHAALCRDALCRLGEDWYCEGFHPGPAD